MTPNPPEPGKEAAAQVTALRPDGRHVAIHPLDVRGWFIRRRRIVFAALIAVYLAAPLVPVGGHPAVHLDVPTRRFFLLGGTFNAQDVWRILLLVLAFAFGLLFVTAWRGRLWCGWGCPQTVFLEALYRPIERLFEGPRSRRMKLSSLPWSAGRVLRTSGKHVAYLAVSLTVAHVTLALFVSMHDLLAMFREGPAAHPVTFGWAMGLTGLMHFNFTWFRAQFCVVLCPYGRLQSVLHDKDSIVIGYDARRGEPRGPMRKLPVVAEGQERGDCIDCKKCVWACPTGIDIRNGFQMECVGCAQCIDVCDEVMDKIGRPRGLIRNASFEDLAGRPTRVVRPRLLMYATLTLLASLGFASSLYARTPFEANVLRPPGVPWVMEGVTVRNQIDVHVVNKSPEAARFTIRVETGGQPVEARIGAPVVELASLAHTRVPVVLMLRRADVRPGLSVEVVTRDERSGEERRQAVKIVAPGAR